MKLLRRYTPPNPIFTAAVPYSDRVKNCAVAKKETAEENNSLLRYRISVMIA
jgi:hypothetical protein